MRILSGMVIFFVLTLVFSSCQVTQSDAESYMERFTENKTDFEKLALKIVDNKTLLSKIDRIILDEDIDIEIKNGLEELEIGMINISSTECNGIAKVEFVVNWTKNVTVYFDKNDCEKINTKQGYHSKAGMIEVWGLGNGWVMWIDYDYI